MSEIQCEVVDLGRVRPHPNADKLEVAEVLGTQCVVPKGTYRSGQRVVWIPPGMLLGKDAIERLGVGNYLKEAKYPGDLVSTKCRVGACRLRGQVSYGVVTHAKLDMAIGDRIDRLYGAVKYEPPVRFGLNGRAKGLNGDAAPDYPEFHRYTDVQNHYRYAGAFPEGMPVRFTEKLHGTNCRLGLVKRHDEFQFMAGSHKVNWKQETAAGKTPLWWNYMSQEVMELLSALCHERHTVIVFGEIVGPGIQDLDYGHTEPKLLVFDIAIDGTYLDWSEVENYCGMFFVETVPLLYKGPYSKDLMDEFTCGDSVLPGKSKFKGREGIVITPLKEQFSDIIGGRLILKSVSADYLDRKNAQDNE